MDDLVQRKNLIQYLPDFMKQFGELREITRVEDYQFVRMDRKMQSVLNNAFIEDADEYGIQKYESLLGVVPDAEETLESRKRRVLLYWNNAVPYTYRVLIAKLNTYCGINGYDIDMDLENYSISLSIYGKTDISEIEQFLENALPQNIVYNVRSSIADLRPTYIGNVWQDDEIFNLKEAVI